jgi:hypothetical protein
MSKPEHKAKVLNLDEVYDFMKVVVGQPMLYHNFLIQGAEKFETNSYNFSFYVRLVCGKCSDFVILRHDVIYPEGMLGEANTLYWKEFDEREQKRREEGKKVIPVKALAAMNRKKFIILDEKIKKLREKGFANDSISKKLKICKTTVRKHLIH